MRVALKISYNGTHFLGSQTQTQSKNTILGKIEHVLAKLGIEQRVQASGRTDKGVHATAQVCHIDLPPFWEDLGKLERVMNEMLPPTIHVRSIQKVSDDFHARYSAKKRLYRYILKEGNSNPFEESFITFIPTLDFAQIQEKIKLFEGTHDFAFFMKSGSEIKSSIRTIYKAFAYRYKGRIVLCFEANGFLRSQIRMMVGALLTRSSEEIQACLECKIKYKIKPAKSNGLYLARISY